MEQIGEQATPLLQPPPAPEVELVPTSKFADLRYKFEFFNPFQSAFVPHYNLDENVVVSARTGAGKTVVAEMAFYNAVMEKGKRAIFLAPMKSLTKEKYDDWSDPKHVFSEVGVSIVSGDYRLTDARQKELNRSKIVLMTSEMLDSRSRRMNLENNEWLLKTDVLVVDEAHIIGMWQKDEEPLKARGHKLEAALIRFSKLNPSCRIILLSATLPNLPQLGEWLTKLNGKKTEIVVSSYVPQPQEWHLETYEEKTGGYGSYQANKQRMFDKGMEILKAYPDDMWLVFCHSKLDGRAMQRMMSNEFEVEVPFHSADLDKDERINFEKDFKSKKNKWMVATSTLAYGVNLPARRVMILDSKRGLSEVHAYDIKQMGGRAGRPGIDPRGDIHWIVGNWSAKRAQFIIDNMPDAKSLMFDVDVFAFHVVAEIAEGGIKSKADVVDYYNRCLACHQGAKVDEHWLMRLVARLIEHEAILCNELDGALKATALGRIASWMYFSPFDVFHWASNLKELVEKGIKTDVGMAWMWSSIRSNKMDYIPKDAQDLVESYLKAIKNANIDTRSLRGCECAAAAMWLHLQDKDSDIPQSLIAIARNLTFDCERYAQALTLIDNMYTKLGKAEAVKLLGIRVAYGVDWDCARLCTLPGIGKARAKKLIEAGIKSVKMLKKMDELGIKVLGEKIYNSAVAEQATEEEG